MSTSAGSDVWLRGGVIVDGTGAPPFEGQLRLHGDTIADIVPSDVDTEPHCEVVDCTGLVVVPGFIDIHTHSDVSFLLNPLADSKVMQGVTTEVVGNCGFSAFPVNPRRRDALEEFLCGLGEPRIEAAWTDFDGYASTLAARRPVMNVAPLVGHGSLRIDAIGIDDRPVAPDGLAALDNSLRAALEQGAFGMSTGLSYVPSMFAGVEEIHAMGRVLEEYDALYSTHGRASPGLDAFDEAIEVGRRTGVRVQFSHVAINDPRMWGRAGDVLDRFESAVDAGVDLKYDVYPYDASASSLTQYLPGWLQMAGEAGLREQLDNRRLFERARCELANGLYGTIPWDWHRVVVSLAGTGDEELEGQSIAKGAAARGIQPEELCLQLCRRHGNTVQVVLFYRTEADVTEFLTHPLAILGSDGRAMSTSAPGRPHPRNFGAHARLLQRCVNERATLSLADAVHKCTLGAADRLGITDRGRIAEGVRADVVVLDVDAIRETASWTRPTQLAEGVRDVWINGQRVVRSGALTAARPGRVLRRGGQ